MRKDLGPDRGHVPHACGVYIMRDAGEGILYIGKAKDLARRVAQYFNPNKPDLKNSLLAPLVRGIDYLPCASEREALLLERRLIHKHQPFFNAMWKDDKSYPYIRLSLGEDFPRLALTRRKLNDGSLYFGPYPQVAPIKSLLAYLWRRRLFPLRPCRWEFSVKRPLARAKIQACLYYHTRQCPAPCCARISRQDYRRIAENAALFFSGKHAALRTAFTRQMRTASQRLQYERAAELRDSIQALDQLDERVRLRALRAEDLTAPLESSRAVSDLQKALGLPAPPHHVECFDVSHFQGRQMVASMVCFQGGEPCREHYRRFRLREVAGIDDPRSIAEAVRRRYRRLAESGEPLPDLVLVDGGKGQLSAAAAELAALDLPPGRRLPRLAALAKRIEEVFLPGRAESLILERNHPGLRLLQRLRDEAHRFGVAYHRLLRSRALLRSPGK
ncbi:MAG: excinuclease ABC subunit UvrC [Elusimicrobiota bacterium]|jgi:excinuclease ABC subunit C